MEAQDFISWVISQGVAVAVLAFILFRLEGKLAELAKGVADVGASLHTVIDLLGRRNSS